MNEEQQRDEKKMAFNKIKPSLYDQITELQRKIQLLEGGRNAHYESSRSIIEKNSEALRQLRQENKRLYRELADVNAGDEHVIRAAFHNRGLEKHAFRNMSEEEALTTLEQRRLSETKQLNALKHKTKTYQRRLEELKEEYERLKPEAGAVCPDARRNEEDAMNRWTLENRLEKTQLKCKEGENIMANYLKLKSHLQDESLTFQGQLDSLKEEILKHREELQGMQLIYKEAKVAKEEFKAEMQRLEERLHRERKERERVVASYRRNFEECKAEAEKNERRAQRTAMQPDEVSSEAQRSATRMEAEEEKAISTFEEVYRNVKEATGATNVQEIVERFTSQRDTYQHLEEVKVENEAVLLQLKEQKKLLSQQLDNLKYCGEARLSSERRTLEESEQQLQAQQQKSKPAKENLDRLIKTLGAARAGVEHLAEKLQHISASEDPDADVQPHSEEMVVELLKQCQLKLQAMSTELEETDLAAVMKEMEEEAFLVRMEGKLPEYNTRIKLPGDQTQELFDDEDEREEDEADVVSREALKRQSQLIIDSNPKKKPWKKKKGKF
ncbi:coiled-coil domain-containing protein 151 [Salarias fasciatus]|uniref:coiled-coil domain-containing protein 151 n=1 Tax=Salarias fasciatus TaxID=181472 RepID=UPI001176E5BC|nr:coiled-coil domain-containing protein 151-like [Salarias fasciatus]